MDAQSCKACGYHGPHDCAGPPKLRDGTALHPAIKHHALVMVRDMAAERKRAAA